MLEASKDGNKLAFPINSALNLIKTFPSVMQLTEQVRITMISMKRMSRCIDYISQVFNLFKEVKHTISNKVATKIFSTANGEYNL